MCDTKRETRIRWLQVYSLRKKGKIRLYIKNNKAARSRLFATLTHITCYSIIISKPGKLACMTFISLAI